MKNAVFISVLFFASLLFSEDVIQKVDDGFINWTEMTVTITGSGVPDLGISNANSAKLSAEKAAKMNVTYRFSKALAKIELGSGKDLEKHLAEIKDSEFLKNIERNAKWSEMYLEKQYSDGSVDYIFKFDIKPQLSEIIKKTSAVFALSPVVTTEVQEPAPAENIKNFLVIDLSGHKMGPVLFPSIETSDGEIIFNITKVKNEFCKTGGFYRIRNKSDAFLEKLDAKENLLIISPNKIKNRSVVIVSRDDALKMKTMLKPEVFSEGRVILSFK